MTFASRPIVWIRLSQARDAKLEVRYCPRGLIMPDAIVFLWIFIGIVIISSAAKVIQYKRQSDKQWKEVDKSKLKEWDDDDDW